MQRDGACGTAENIVQMTQEAKMRCFAGTLRDTQGLETEPTRTSEGQDRSPWGHRGTVSDQSPDTNDIPATPEIVPLSHASYEQGRKKVGALAGSYPMGNTC
jgi:hypothetical protein